MFLSKTSIVITIFLVFIANSIWQLIELFIHPKCDNQSFCVESFLRNNENVQLLFFTSTDINFKNDVQFIWRGRNFDYEKPFSREFNISIAPQIRSNAKFYLHIILLKNEVNFFGEPTNDIIYQKDKSSSKISLAKNIYPVKEYFMLSTKNMETKEKRQKRAHIKTKVSFSIFISKEPLPRQNLPPELYSLISFSYNNEYYPIIVNNFLQDRLEYFKEIKPENETVQIQVDYSPIGIGKLRLLIQLKQAINSMYNLGFTEKDIESIKEIFSDGNIYLLCLTFFVASIHLIFDFLAFKNDVLFWKNKKSLAGLSFRAIIWRSFSHLVIFLYLLDENTTLLVVIPSAIGTLIEFWKLTKIFKINVNFEHLLPRVNFELKSYNEKEKETEKADAEGMKYFLYVLYPICVFGAIYSLIYTPQKSWYSWVIHSLTNGVYAFGFIFMLPQLIVNYKMKSVEALPFRVFMYKAFNTFIDDLFAFIITMPTAHRVACFRDDIVFLVYLYQRWLYPVDHSREFEGSDKSDSKICDKKNK